MAAVDSSGAGCFKTSPLQSTLSIKITPFEAGSSSERCVGLTGCGKTLRSSFESLRTNGVVVEYAEVFRSC